MPILNTPRTLLNGVTTTATGSTFSAGPEGITGRTFVAYVAGTGAVSATVLIEVGNDNTRFITLATITLSGTTSDTDGFVADESWEYVRARVSAISGTGAAVTVTMSE